MYKSSINDESIVVLIITYFVIYTICSQVKYGRLPPFRDKICSIVKTVLAIFQEIE